MCMCTDITLPCMFSDRCGKMQESQHLHTPITIALSQGDNKHIPLGAMKTQSMNLLTQYNSSLKTLNAGIH